MVHAGFPIYQNEGLTICDQQEWTKLSVDIENTAASIIELEAQVYEQLCGMVGFYTRFNTNQPVLPIGLSLNTELVIFSRSSSNQIALYGAVAHSLNWMSYPRSQGWQ
jgi:hypothetical protein